MTLVDKLFANLFGIIPDISKYAIARIDFKYQSNSIRCDEIFVYYDQRYFFKFTWLRAYEAPPWSMLYQWYKTYLNKIGMVR